MKRLLSFLGTSNYKETEYRLAETGTCRTPYIAVALTRLLGADEVVILATDRARETHGDAINSAFQGAGLDTPRLEPIAAGNTPAELWENFRTIATLLQTGGQDGEIVIDITHGFRSQPFFTGAVVSHVRALGTAAPSLRILYGAFEARHGGRTPVWDLTPFVELVDWTQAIRAFLETGAAEGLARRAETLGRQMNRHWAQAGKQAPKPRIAEFATALRDFGDALTTLRTGDLLLPRGGHPSAAAHLARTLPEAARDIEAHIPPLAGVVAEIQAMLEPLQLDQDHLSGPAGQKVMAALADLYLRLGRYAEAAATLREGWVNLYAPPAATRPGEGFDMEARRRAERRLTNENDKTQRKLIELRNDIEHGGFRETPRRPQTIYKQLEDFTAEFESARPAPPEESGEGTVWFVSRHPGAVEWARRQGLEIDRLVDHLEVERVQPGDTVIGTLPVNLAAEVCRRGARFLNLSLELPPEARGRELSADDLDKYGARLEEYEIRKIQGAEDATR